MSSEPRTSGPVGGPRAIVAGHGDFAAGLVTAVEQITGRGWQFVPVAVHQLSVQDIEELIRQRMVDAAVHVIFTDLAAGSCTMAARHAAERGRASISVHGGAACRSCSIASTIG